MKAAIGCLVGLVFGISASAEPLLEGRVRLESGQPVADAQVQLFDLTNLRRGAIARAMTDGTGYFALPLAAPTGRALPARFALGPNYPNPFNPSTIIPYQLAASSQVRLEVFNLLGQRIATLVDEARPAGFHTATWHATDGSGRAVAAGVYIYRMTVGEERQTGRMVLIDGQAGIPAAGAAGPMPMQASALERVEADAGVYGLTVSGAGLVAYVNPAFRVGADEVDIVVEEHSGRARMKLLAGGILGDVNNDGQVDASDMLYIVLYSRNPSITLPNNGDISLGDVNGDGTVDSVDALLLSTYLNDPSDPSLPAGIGEPVGETTTTASQIWKLYWTDAGTDKIQRSNLDGSVVEDLVTTGLDWPYGLALDVSGGKLYWTDRGTAKIQRSNLDGSGVEDLVTTGLESPVGLALDVSGGKLYWTDRGTAKIQRSNLDGSDVEDLVTTGLESPVGLALDVSGGKLYWTDIGTDKIQRSNLDGSGVEDLVTTGLESPVGLALDVSGGKLYWTDGGTDKIQRSNLDGSGVEDLVTTGLESPVGLALDVSGGKLYWTDRGTDKIQRSNLDGSGVEDLVTTGLSRPGSIALGFVPVVAGPDLVVRASVSDNSLTPGQSFELSVTVRNQGTEQAPATTLRYYRSDDETIDATDTQLRTAAVNSLASLADRAYSIDLRALSSEGMYHYGACVESVSGESNTDNNCSSAVTVTVDDGDSGDGDDGGDDGDDDTFPLEAVGQLQCEGTYTDIFQTQIRIKITGRLRARRAVSSVTVAGYVGEFPSRTRVGADGLGSFRAGETKAFSISGTVHPFVLSSSSICEIEVDWEEVGSQGSGSAKLTAGDAESSEQVRVQGSLSPSSALINRKQSLEQP